MTIINLEFGKQYTVNATMYKKRTTEGLKTHELHRTTWEKREIEPVQMMYIGYRYVSEGVMYWGHNEGDEWQDFQPSKRLRLLLFVPNEHKNPVYVHPDCVRLL